MQKLFNKILVPVDCSSGSKDVAEKAYSIAKKYDCSIHLLGVISVSPFAIIANTGTFDLQPHKISNDSDTLKLKLEQLCRHIDFLSGDTMHVDHSIIYGTWNQAVIDFVNGNKIDLVLIGQPGTFLQKRKMVLNPDLIAEKTNAPVITIPTNRRLVRLYSIVIPITDFLPVRKLIYGIYMALNLGATIKLLGIENFKTREKVQYYLKKAEKLISDSCDIHVEKETIISENVAEAVNHFAIRESVDLIIVNPGTQTKMPGFFSSLIGNILQKYSAPPVLTISPV